VTSQNSQVSIDDLMLSSKIGHVEGFVLKKLDNSQGMWAPAVLLSSFYAFARLFVLDFYACMRLETDCHGSFDV
jgi:hypothetical protein